jgi:hypothetical protein
VVREVDFMSFEFDLPFATRFLAAFGDLGVVETCFNLIIDVGFVGEEEEGAREAKWEVGEEGTENTEVVDCRALEEKSRP